MPRRRQETAFALQSADVTLSAVYVAPASELAGAALILYPFLEERKAAHRPVVDLARALAGQRIASLRFDLPGAGDSSGPFTLDRWVAHVTTAYDWLTSQTGHRPSLIGVRGGAMLALALAPQLQPPAVVTWALPPSSKRMLRDWVQRKITNEMVMFGKSRSRRSEIMDHLKKGNTTDLEGHRVLSSLYNHLMDLDHLQRKKPPASQLLCLHIGAGSCVMPEWPSLEAETFSQIPPFWNRVGLCDITPLADCTIKWLLHPRKPNREEAPAPTLPAASWPTQLTPSTRLVAINTPDGTIRGCYARPDAAPRGRILMLHGWSGNRGGPHNMFKKAAAKWCEAGYAVLRIDFRGRGDSDAPEHHKASIQTMCQDAKDALTWLRNTATGHHPDIIVAICSGSKVALSLAATTPGINRLVLWSAEAMGNLRAGASNRKKTLAALRLYAKKLCTPETWKKILSGTVQTSMVKKAVVQHETRSKDEAAREDQMLKKLQSYTGDVLMIYGGSDPDTPRTLEAYTKWFRKQEIPLDTETIPDANHSYYSRAWEQAVIGKSSAWLQKPLQHEADGAKRENDEGERESS